MMALISAVIEWDKIGELLWVAPLAGLAVAITYSLMIVGFSRAGEARRDGDGGAAGVAYSLLAFLSTAAFLAVVVYGVVIIIKK
jgi:cation transporter-like permease